MRLLNGFFVALFVLATAVQYNDPDPVRWMVMYLSAAAVSAIAAARRLHWAVPAVVGLTALGWALTLLPEVVRRGGAGGFFKSWGMANVGIEEGRELYGLLVAAGWMTVVAIQQWRNRNVVQIVR